MTLTETSHQEKYWKLRKSIREWEFLFQEKYNRKPTSKDVKKYPKVVQYYKTYEKLKKKLTGKPLDTNENLESVHDTTSMDDKENQPLIQSNEIPSIVVKDYGNKHHDSNLSKNERTPTKSTKASLLFGQQKSHHLNNGQNLEEYNDHDEIIGPSPMKTNCTFPSSSLFASLNPSNSSKSLFTSSSSSMNQNTNPLGNSYNSNVNNLTTVFSRALNKSKAEKSRTLLDGEKRFSDDENDQDDDSESKSLRKLFSKASLFQKSLMPSHHNSQSNTTTTASFSSIFKRKPKSHTTDPMEDNKPAPLSLQRYDEDDSKHDNGGDELEDELLSMTLKKAMEKSTSISSSSIASFSKIKLPFMIPSTADNDQLNAIQVAATNSEQAIHEPKGAEYLQQKEQGENHKFQLIMPSILNLKRPKKKPGLQKLNSFKNFLDVGDMMEINKIIESEEQQSKHMAQPSSFSNLQTESSSSSQIVLDNSIGNPSDSTLDSLETSSTSLHKPITISKENLTDQTDTNNHHKNMSDSKPKETKVNTRKRKASSSSASKKSKVDKRDTKTKQDGWNDESHDSEEAASDDIRPTKTRRQSFRKSTRATKKSHKSTNEAISSDEEDIYDNDGDDKSSISSAYDEDYHHDKVIDEKSAKENNNEGSNIKNNKQVGKVNKDNEKDSGFSSSKSKKSNNSTKAPKKKKSSATTKKEPKSVSGNFVAMKLNRRGQTGTGPAGRGRGRFRGKKNQKPNYSYSLHAAPNRDEDVHGFEIVEENVLIEVASNSTNKAQKKKINPKEFIFLDTSLVSNEEIKDHLVEIESPYLNTPVWVDLEKALFILTGFNSFRPCQRETITRILQNKSTFLVIGTGSGKSLCYQLSTFILQQSSLLVMQEKEVKKKALSIVIVPTISLMADQMKCIPSLLQAVCWNANVNQYECIQKLESGETDVLFVSPERFSTSYFQSIMKRIDQEIWFVCVDEAHCVDEWSHGFRPTYLSLGKVLKEMEVNCILACTGTATSSARNRIPEMLGMNPQRNDTASENIIDDCVVALDVLRSNLKLFITKVHDHSEREQSVLKLLSSNAFQNFHSIIIYTMFQAQADKLASTLRIHNIQCESYHAGKDPVERTIIQTRFMNGKIKVIVATVSFGLGLNKSNIQAIIHCGLPRSIEEYVQEIGRCARDGSEGSCHLIYCPEDYMKLCSLTFAEGVDERPIRKLVVSLFESAGFVRKEKNKFVCLPYSTLEKSYDMKAAVADTFLNYLVDLDEKRRIQAVSAVDLEFEVHFTKSGLQKLAESNPIIKEVQQHSSQLRGENSVLLNVYHVCQKSKTVTPDGVIKELYTLRKSKEVQFKSTQRGVMVQFDADVDYWKEGLVEKWSDLIVHKMEQLEYARLQKLDDMYTILSSFAQLDVLYPNPAEELHDRIKVYFTEPDSMSTFASLTTHQSDGVQKDETLKESRLKQKKMKFRDASMDETSRCCKSQATIEMKLFIKENLDQLDNGRAVARIFHGLASPAFPYQQWSKFKQWGSFKHVYFKDLQKTAQKILTQIKSKVKE